MGTARCSWKSYLRLQLFNGRREVLLEEDLSFLGVARYVITQPHDSSEKEDAGRHVRNELEPGSKLKSEDSIFISAARR